MVPFQGLQLLGEEGVLWRCGWGSGAPGVCETVPPAPQMSAQCFSGFCVSVTREYTGLLLSPGHLSSWGERN